MASALPWQEGTFGRAPRGAWAVLRQGSTSTLNRFGRARHAVGARARGARTHSSSPVLPGRWRPPPPPRSSPRVARRWLPSWASHRARHPGVVQDRRPSSCDRRPFIGRDLGTMRSVRRPAERLATAAAPADCARPCPAAGRERVGELEEGTRERVACRSGSRSPGKRLLATRPPSSIRWRVRARRVLKPSSRSRPIQRGSRLMALEKPCLFAFSILSRCCSAKHAGKGPGAACVP